MNRLTKLANKYGTDKGSNCRDSHCYTEFYQQFFEKYEHPKILEIGIYHGGATRMLNDFFDGDCEIWACDWEDDFKQYVEDMPNVHFVHLDVSNKNDIAKLAKSLEGVGIDIIIDDASHFWYDQMILLLGLNHLLTDDGIYILEDIHFSRLFIDPENSPLFFINFLQPNCMLTEEENSELINRIKDVQIFSRKNVSTEDMINKYGGRSMTSVITFE